MTFVFYDAFNHVWTHPTTGAKLFQGNRDAAIKPASEVGAKSIAIVADNMIGNPLDLQAHQAGSKKRGYEKFRSAPIRDVGSMIPSELEQTKVWANEVADRLFEDMATYKRSVLVCCWSGYNRSGLVAALVMKKGGVGGQEAIDFLQARRSPWAMNNDLFKRVVRGEA